MRKKEAFRSQIGAIVKQCGTKTVNLGPKRAKKWNLGPKLVQKSCCAAPENLNLGPKRAKKWNLGPKLVKSHAVQHPKT